MPPRQDFLGACYFDLLIEAAMIVQCEKHWSKRSKESGQFMDQEEKRKFKGVRRER
jgi:hypothetical protein